METVANEPDRAVIKSAASKLQRIAEASIPFTDFLISAGDPITVRNASGWVEESSIEGFSHAEVEALLYTLDPEWERELASGRMSKTMPTESWQLRISAYMAFAASDAALPFAAGQNRDSGERQDDARKRAGPDLRHRGHGRGQDHHHGGAGR